MKIITKIEIRNFRSIGFLEIGDDINDLNIFVGNNDVGKSNILRALNLFFNHETDIGKSFNFDDDFNKNIIRTTGRGQYVKVALEIALKYETEKKVRWTKKWNNKGEISEDKYEVFLNDGTPSDFTRGSRAPSWLNNLKFRYVPAVKSAQYFQYLFEELHDLLNSTFGDLFLENTQALLAGVHRLTAEITGELNKYLQINNRITLPSDLRKFFGTLDFSMESNSGAKFYLANRGDGIKIRHIPIILKFMADRANTGKQGALNVQTIWGFEEPENNLEMTHAFAMATYFNDCSEDIQILLTTHSPAFYSLQDKGDNVSCFYVKRNDKDYTIPVNVKDETVDLDQAMGMLNYITPFLELKNQELLQKGVENEKLKEELSNIRRTKRIMVFTEDSSDELSMIKGYMAIQGFLDTQLEYTSYNGKANLRSAVQTAKLMATQLDHIRYFIFHRDRDCDGIEIEEELTTLLKKNGDNFVLLLSQGYDLDSNFINPQHLHSLYPQIPIAQIEQLIQESIDEKQDTTLEKLHNTLLPIMMDKQRKYNILNNKNQNNINHYQLIQQINAMYFADKRRYMYGKSVLTTLKGKMQAILQQNINPFRRTNHLFDPGLAHIANEIRQH